MTTKLSKAEFQIMKDVLERMDAEALLHFDEHNMFRFANISCKEFLVELPKVVDILSRHKSECRYDDFVRSSACVVDVLTEIFMWKFCIDLQGDLIETLREADGRLSATEH